MKNGKRVRRDESPSDISPRGLAGQAAISSFSCPSFSWPLLSSLFSVYTKGVLKVAKRQKNVHFAIYIKTRRCETHIETVLECARITRIVEILVFGAGAIGSFFGGLLSQRHDVTLIGRAEHISAVKSHGLRVSGKTSIIAKPRAALRVAQDAKPDFIFVTTKSYDTANAMIALRAFADRAIFVTLQNGLGNAETIARTARRVVAGTTAHGGTFVGPGAIRHAGAGETMIGARRRGRRRRRAATSDNPRREADGREPGEHAPRLGPTSSNRNRRNHRVDRQGRRASPDSGSIERKFVRARAGQRGGVPSGLGVNVSDQSL